ncbi:MAG: DNA repair protein RadC [Candidatus Kapaibacterium sp.]|jgi:DNA repair protein RadC|nr:DNA repair protein RadC [Candidatus Kapabacteria bacterium]
MPIKEWREDERPRERMIKLGPAALSDSELLAILIGFGTGKKTALDIAKDILAHYGNISEVARCDAGQLKTHDGIGLAKAVTICTAFELSRRIAPDPIQMKVQITSPEDISEYYMPRLRDLRKEIFLVLSVNRKNRIIRETIVGQGVVDQVLVDPREVFRNAIIESASGVFLIHNHPSGDVSPSEQDKIITNRMVQAGNIIGIKVIDHLIFGFDKYFSFSNADLI